MKANATDTAVISAMEFSYRSPIGEAWVVEGSAGAILSRARRYGILTGIGIVLAVAGLALVIGLVTGFIPNWESSDLSWLGWAGLGFLMILGMVSAVILGGMVVFKSVTRQAVVEISPSAALVLTPGQRDAVVQAAAEDREAGMLLADEISRLHEEQDMSSRSAETGIAAVEQYLERGVLDAKRAKARKAARDLE